VFYRSKFGGQPMTRPVIIERAETFYGKMKITDKCTVMVGCKVTRNYL
jgi:hypothetical protein